MWQTLIEAAKAGILSAIQALLADGADVNTKTNNDDRITAGKIVIFVQ